MPLAETRPGKETACSSGRSLDEPRPTEVLPTAWIPSSPHAGGNKPVWFRARRPRKHGVIHQDEESAAGPTASVTNALELFTAAFRQDGRFLSRSFIYEENSAWNGIITPPVNQLSRLSHGVQAHQCLEDKRYTFDYPWARHDLKRKEERGKIKELP